MNDATTAAELAAIADAVDRELGRVRDLATRRAAQVAGGDSDAGDDLLAAMYEAERALSSASRAVRRAARAPR
jgi:hypothetical protein